MSTTLKIAAAWLARHPKHCLFPVRRLAKSPPCFENNLNIASSDLQQIAKWDADYGGPNWGLALKKSGLVVIDVDVKPGKVGAATLFDLEITNGALPDTLTVRTTSGGGHYYFTETNLVQHQCRVGVAGFGKDLDCPNYTVIAGCYLKRPGLSRQQHRDNYWNAISPQQPRYVIECDLPIAPAPDWFADYLKPDDSVDVEQTPAVELDTPNLIEWAIHFLTHDARSSIQGSNGEYVLLMTAGVLKNRGISEHKSVELLAKYYNVPPPKDREPSHPYCDPLWSVGDGPVADRLDVKVHNAWLYLTKTRPGADTAEADFAGNVPDAADIDALVAWWTKRDKQHAEERKMIRRRLKKYLSARIPTTKKVRELNQ